MGDKGFKIISIVGARPNFMKMAAISRAVAASNQRREAPHIENIIVHTGQHYDERMSALFFRDLEIPRPLYNLEVGSASHAAQTAEIMKRFEPVLLKERPDALLLMGDVNSTVACALVASKIRIRRSPGTGMWRPLIAHVEAGLRSHDRDMPEEINRLLTDALSDLLFITEKDALGNLRAEGIASGKIHLVGNVMIDSLIASRKRAEELDVTGSLPELLDPEYPGNRRPGLRPKEYGIITLHRPGNVDSPGLLGPFVDCIGRIASMVPLIFPLHPRTRDRLKRFGFLEELAGNGNVIFTRPLGYLEFLGMLLGSRMVLTDSGGVQEETTYLGIPCITLRENTERPVTVTMGTNYLVGTSPARILDAAFGVIEGRSKTGSIPPLWDGKTGERIVDILQNELALRAFLSTCAG